jgi:hypothetical protein
VQFTAASTTAAQIAASQHSNNAWTPLGEWAACANPIRNMFLHLDRTHPTTREIAILIKLSRLILAEQLGRWENAP